MPMTSETSPQYEEVHPDSEGPSEHEDADESGTPFDDDGEPLPDIELDDSEAPQ